MSPVNSGKSVEQNDTGVRNVGLRKGIEVNSRNRQKCDQPPQQSSDDSPGMALPKRLIRTENQTTSAPQWLMHRITKLVGTWIVGGIIETY